VTGPAGYTPGRDPDAPHASRAAPLAESICWRPTEGEAIGPGAQQYPIYVRQRALAALHDHFRGSATQGILGFLVGALLEDPSTRERWLELEFIVRLTQPIYGDKTTLVISRVWERLQQEVGRTGGHMLGWYHSHPPLGTEIAPGDIEAHEQYFGRPWQIALVLGQTAKGPSGAFYRPSAGLPLGTTPLPFFEIVARDSITPEGRKRTRVTWKNYRPDLRRTSGVVTGVSALLQALQPRPSEPAASPPPIPPAAAPAPLPEPAPSAQPGAPPSPGFAATAATRAPARAEGRTNTPPRGSGAIRVAATTAPRTAEPPLPPPMRVSAGIEKTPEPVSFAPAPTPAAAAPPPAVEPAPAPVAGVPTAGAAAEAPPRARDVAPVSSRAAPTPEAPATPEPLRPRPRNPAIAGLPIIEPPTPARASAPVASAAPAPVSPAAPPPAQPPGLADTGRERLRPSVHSAGGLDILRALPAAQTPADRPAVSAVPVPRPSRDRPTSEVLQELADAITRAARTSGPMPAVDASAPGSPGRATAPRKVPLVGAGGGARTPASASPAVRAAPLRGPEPGRRESAPVTFTPAVEPPTRRPGPPEPRAARESAGVTFTPVAAEPAAAAGASPLEPAFAPKLSRAEPEPEALPDALRGERPSPPSDSGASLAETARPAAPAPPAPRASRVARRSFGAGLQAEPEPAASVARLPYLLALLAALGGAVWFFAIRPRTVAVPAAGVPVASAPVDSGPPAAAIAPVESVAVESLAAPTAVNSVPSAPPVVVPDVLTPLDLLVDSLDAAIFQYLDRAAVFDAGVRDCQSLATGLVGVDRLWVAYNAQRRRLDAPLDSLRTLRDQAAYANVEAVDTHFGRSGCPRP